MAAPQALDEGVAEADELRPRLGLQPAHGPQPGTQPALVSLEDVVGLHLVRGGGERLVEDAKVRSGSAGDDLSRLGLGGSDGPLEEPASGSGFPLGTPEPVR